MINMPAGRPRKNIDKKQFENLCGLQCTILEIAGWFDCDPDTIEAFCKREYGKKFSEVFALKRGKGKVSLRRSQWRLAENNAAMAIWLGKQYLEQRDTPAETQAENKAVEALVEAIKKV